MLVYSLNILLLSLVISRHHRGAGLRLADQPDRAARCRRLTVSIIAFRAAARRTPPRSSRRRAAPRDRPGGGGAGGACSARCGARCSPRSTSRRARPRGRQDQPRPAQHAGLGAAAVRPAGRRSTARVQRSRAETGRHARPRHRLCQSTLTYGAAQEKPPSRQMFALAPLVEEVREPVGLCPAAPSAGRDHRARPGGRRRSRAVVPRAAQSGAQQPCRRWSSARRTIPPAIRCDSAARRDGAVVSIEVSDTGPGVPLKARAAPVRGVPGLGPKRRHRAWSRDRGRAGARARRHHSARRRTLARRSASPFPTAPSTSAPNASSARALTQAAWTRTWAKKFSRSSIEFELLDLTRRLTCRKA